MRRFFDTRKSKVLEGMLSWITSVSGWLGPFMGLRKHTEIEPENLVILEGHWPHDTETTQGFMRGTVEALPSTAAGCREHAVKKRKGWSRFTHFGVLYIS